MRSSFIFFAIIFSIIFISPASSSSIRGIIYGPDLEIVTDVRIKLYSGDNVVQSIISKNGSYALETDEGEYVLEGVFIENGEIKLNSIEEIIVLSGRDYNIDIVLLSPEELDIFDDFNPNTEINDKSNYVLFIIVFLLIVLVFYYIYKTKFKKIINKKEIPKDLENVLKLIRDEGGRINQTELRKKLPYSEAKVSLIIADLEERGLIRKVKRGRGNLIILK